MCPPESHTGGNTVTQNTVLSVQSITPIGLACEVTGLNKVTPHSRYLDVGGTVMPVSD